MTTQVTTMDTAMMTAVQLPNAPKLKSTTRLPKFYRKEERLETGKVMFPSVNKSLRFPHNL